MTTVLLSFIDLLSLDLSIGWFGEFTHFKFLLKTLTPWQDFHSNTSKYHDIPQEEKKCTDSQIPQDLTQGVLWYRSLSP